MADPKAPEMLVNVGASTGPYWVRLDRLQELLATQGFAIVSEADRKVLEACAAMTIGMPSCPPRPPAKMGPIPKAGVMAVVEAELARRSEA